MTIKVVVELQAKPGARAELKNLLTDISATHGPTAPGFLGSTVYEVLDNADGLVEIAEWESAEAQAAAVGQATAAGIYAPVVALVATPLKATRIGHPSPGHRSE
jgi:quinol monooxygenase YgiN